MLKGRQGVLVVQYSRQIYLLCIVSSCIELIQPSLSSSENGHFAVLFLQNCNQESIFYCTYKNSTAALSSWAVRCVTYSKLLCLLHGCLATCRYAVIQHALQHTPHFHLFSSDLVILFSPVMEGCSCSGLVCFVSSRMQSGKGKKKKRLSQHPKLLKETFAYTYWKIRGKVLKI